MKPGDLIRVRSSGRLRGKVGLILEHRPGGDGAAWVVLIDGTPRWIWAAETDVELLT